MSKFLDAVGLARFKDKLESKWKLKFDEVYNKTEVDELITAKVAEIVAGAPEDFNTLKEMSDWLAEHEDSAAAMNTAIQKNADDIETANTNIAKKLDKTTKYAASDEVGGAAAKVKTVKATSNTNRAVVFSDINESDTGSTIPYIDPDMHYNPATNTLTVPNIESDTTATLKNDVAINRTTLGTQCKNLFTYPDTTPSTYRGLDFSWKDNVLYITGIATESADSYVPTHPFVTTGSQFDFKEDSIMSIVVEGTHDYLSIHLHDGTENKYHVLSNKTEVKIAAGSVLRGIYIRPEKGVEFTTTYKIMIRNANIIDNTYAPYAPSLQEQIKSQDAVIKTTLGTQCKNLLPYRCVPHNNSGGIKVAVADDGVVTLSGTNTVSFTYNINFTTPMVFDRDVFIVGAEKLSNAIYNCKVDIKVNNSNYPNIGTNGLRIPAGTSIQYLYFQQQTTGKAIDATIAPMIVYADVLDRTYEPYKPSLQEQISQLVARIEALEGSTATTEE